MKNILTDCLIKIHNHATCIQSGMSNDESMRIAFGDEEAEKVKEQLKDIEENTNQ